MPVSGQPRGAKPQRARHACACCRLARRGWRGGCRRPARCVGPEALQSHCLGNQAAEAMPAALCCVTRREQPARLESARGTANRRGNSLPACLP
eukprot:358873-Chlamydomonas_euryale.AAC.2